MKNPFLEFSVAMITPFTYEGQLNLASIPPLINYYKKNNVPSLLISGSTGEQHSMTIEERITLYNKVKEAAQDNFLLYGGVAAVQTKDAIALAIAAEEAGFNGIMLGFPPYLRINQEEAFNYAARICSNTSLPIMLYNNPPRTGFTLNMDTLLKLVKQLPQIIALKEAGDRATVKLVKENLGSEFIVLTGSDQTIVEDAELGFNGISSVLGNVFPNEIHEIVAQIKFGNINEAKELITKLSPNMKTITEIGTLRAIKYILEKQNVPAGICREPISVLNKEEQIKIEGFFE
ncbi:dihydrodipicolinate synthase family protein [Niallia taxi]|uniref:dihydrodipicolinate synthase family protein n=1 Tax=Niallia taxi TaxID=2499688 RepID=UPI0021A35C5C|nr:dihydrodipicolinate synthase family protein [Niallia taxi]MCT2346125.1 dihydrodipicolinate synthase family protein [Niallia taxi]